ncbi:dephospho-CoA kinase [Paratissierella segnis]|jgi:dephospho-CoA kinase|uniref:Dephospho-CoA kinase n=1 Tax=Paratissierella segnis TaxID=2763679 RepID=A0A926EWK7_9FIRM|nr:dephospho-CoA kinase [Paratissierella segnis]MBC8588857.1 dephospho-CoA kinase [Paratissierella segnis]
MIQNDCTLIGLTGGIGTGKSTVSDMLKEKGYKVIDADKISREVVETEKPAYKKIVEVFGTIILFEDGSIDRKKLGKLIFANEDFRNRLNDIVHPYVWESIKNEITRDCINNHIIFLDIALLIEEIDKLGKYDIELNEIWLVYASYEVQLSRLMKRDGISKEYAIDKINSQMELEDKKRYADRIIDNSGDLDSLKKNIDSLLEEFA